MLCIAVAVVPLLLLSTPGLAPSNSATVRPAGLGHVQAVRALVSPATAAAPAATVPDPTTVPPVTTTTEAPPTTTTPSPTTAPLSAPAPATRAEPAPTTTTPATTTPPTTAPPTTTPPTTVPANGGHSESGQATWYGAPDGTCASPDLPFGTVLTVTDQANGARVTCTVEDREDPASGRVLDLSESGFAALADPSEGVIEVTLSW